MNDLPPSWTWATLETVADIQGGIQKQPKRRPVENSYSFLRVANVAKGRLDLTEVHAIELFDGELPRYRLEVGDLLVVEGNGTLSQLGRAAMWRGQVPNCVHQNHLIRVRPNFALNPQYLEYVWNSPVVTQQVEKVGASTSGLHTLSVSKLRPVQVPVPPAAEQRRIVAALGLHLPRVKSAATSLRVARAKIDLLLAAARKEIIMSLADGMQPLGDLLVEIEAGKSFVAEGRPAERDEWGIIKVSAMTWGEFRQDENKAVPYDREIDGRYEIRPGFLARSCG